MAMLGDILMSAYISSGIFRQQASVQRSHRWTGYQNHFVSNRFPIASASFALFQKRSAVKFKQCFGYCQFRGRPGATDTGFAQTLFANLRWQWISFHLVCRKLRTGKTTAYRFSFYWSAQTMRASLFGLSLCWLSLNLRYASSATGTPSIGLKALLNFGWLCRAGEVHDNQDHQQNRKRNRKNALHIIRWENVHRR